LKFSIASIPQAIITAVVPIALLIVTIGAVKTGIIKSAYFPMMERRSVDVSLVMPSGTVEQITDSLLIEIEKKVPALNERFRKQHDGQDIVTAWSRQIRGSNSGSVSLTLLRSDQRKVDATTVGDAFRELVGEIPSAEKLTFGGGRGFGAAVNLALYGDNFEELKEAKLFVKKELEKYPFLKDIIDNDSRSAEEVLLTLKPIAFTLGLTNQYVMNQVRSSFFGGTVQKLQRGIDEVPVVIRFNEANRRSIDDLSNLTIRGISGEPILLREIADFTVQRGVTTISHQDGETEIQILAELGSKTMTSMEVNSQIKKELLPKIQQRFPDVRVSMRGESEASQETTNSAKIVVPLVLFLMYIIVVYTFRSFLQAFIVFLLIPLSIVGIYWGHYIEGFEVSMLSLFGIIALMGIIVNDSLVLVGAFNQNLKDGMSFRDAIVDAGGSRLRPVILTSLTTVAGLWPLIKNNSLHSAFLSPMAISVGYGLIYGTILTLVILPALLYLFNRLKRSIHWVWTGNRIGERDVEPAILEMHENTILALATLDEEDQREA